MSGPGRTDEKEPTTGVVRLIYSSRAAEALSPEQLLEILTQARENNARSGISGLLLHAEQTFLQVLEGDPEVIESLYARIEEDERHTELRVLLREEDCPRAFGDWTMGLVRADREMIAAIPGLNDFLQSSVPHAVVPAEETIRVQKILEQFKTGRWRREISG